MSNLPLFDVAGSALQAQSVRMSTLASNLANIDTLSSSPQTAYRPVQPVFQAVTHPEDPSLTGVHVREIQRSAAEPLARYQPDHPLADEQGYVYAPAIDPVAQMVDLISTSRNYQAGVEILNTARELTLSTLSLGR